MRFFRLCAAALLFSLGVLACNLALPDVDGTPAGGERTPPPATVAATASAEASASPVPIATIQPATAPAITPQASPTATLDVPRIRIRQSAGSAEFFDPSTGATFVPRGVNYIQFLPTGNGSLADCVMSANHYDPGAVRAAFRHLSEYGYNTVRIFFDTCAAGPGELTNWEGEGLNPAYLDNMVDLMRIAGEEGIYIIFTANDIPGGGGYWTYFDEIFFADDHFGFEDARNADWLHPAGLETKRKIWQDLLEGLISRQAPLAVVLGWQLTNEYWLWGDAAAPFTLSEGLVTTANGQTYDMADPGQKQQMAVDGALFFIEELVATIKEYDPESLTTMGFYAPHFSPDRYIVTADLLPVAPLDFWDFHAYYDANLTIQELAESFGMIGYEEKPIIMGETAAGYESVPSAVSALQFGLQWLADSCTVGFDGWLYWGYYPWPDEVGGKAWAFLEDEERIFNGMSPRTVPDLCHPPPLEIRNIAHNRPVIASSTLPDQPPALAVDGNNGAWNAGNFPPGWIEVDLGQPATIARVGLNTEQWPPGITRHRIDARLADGSSVFLGLIERFTTPQINLGVDLAAPLAGVVAVRITTLSGPAWVGWREIEVISAEAGLVPACIGTPLAPLTWRFDPMPDSRPVANFDAGPQIWLDGQYTAPDGQVWARGGGGIWTPLDQLSLGESCSQTLPAVQPAPRLVPVTFEVTVPAGTADELFLSGQFEGMPFDPWIPYMIVLDQQSGSSYRLEMLLPLGSEVQYVYTRGSWETIERPAGDCANTTPRTFTVADLPEMTITDAIARWRDLDCDGR